MCYQHIGVRNNFVSHTTISQARVHHSRSNCSPNHNVALDFKPGLKTIQNIQPPPLTVGLYLLSNLSIQNQNSINTNKEGM